MNPNMPYDSNALKNMVSRVKVYCSHIIPLVFDNTLSYYESLCAFCAKVNELCDAVNAQNLTIAEFTHLVEVEITKFEEYIQTELNGVKNRLDTVEDNVRGIDRRLSDTERDLESLTETVRGINGRVGTLEINSESMQSDIAELQTIASTHSGQIMILQNTMSALQNTVNSINTALSNKVDKSDVVDIVQENNMNPVTSNAVYETVTGGITPTIADATRSTKGVVQIGDNIDVSNGEISVPKATQLTFGVMYPGVGVSIPQNQAGVLNLNTATENAIGGVKVGGNINVTNDGTISVATADSNTKGVVQIGDNIYETNGIIKVKEAEAGTVKGVVTIDNMTSNLTLTNGVLDVPTATHNDKGVVSVGSNINVSGGEISVATAGYSGGISQKGVMSIADQSLDNRGLSLTGGLLNVEKASHNNLGVVQIGNNLTATNGVVDVATAQLDTKGLMKVPTNSAVSLGLDGAIDVKDATTLRKGVVQLTDTITDGDTTHVPTADAVYDAITGQTPPQIADATTSSKGIVQIGDNINVSSGEISVPDASTTTKGVVKYGNNFNINSNGQLAVNTGENITTDANGAIKVNTADSINKGVVSIGSNIDITNGAISVPDASTSTKGVVKYGNNFNINSNGQLAINTGENVTTDANGAIKVNTADTINKGVVSIGDNLSISGTGALSVPTATNATKGVLSVDGTNGLTIASGIIGVNKADELGYGTVMIGDNISSNNGLISVPSAGVSTAGVVTVGDNISVTDGEISVADATTSSKGVVRLANSVTSGDTSHVPTADAVYQAVQGAGGYYILKANNIANFDIQSTTGFTVAPTTENTTCTFANAYNHLNFAFSNISISSNTLFKIILDLTLDRWDTNFLVIPLGILSSGNKVVLTNTGFNRDPINENSYDLSITGISFDNISNANLAVKLIILF